MNIKLISPLMSLRPMDSEYKRLMSPSLSLLTIAALTPREHHVYIEDENTGNLNIYDDPDLVGITVNVDTSKRAYDIAALYKQKGIPVVLGGIHPSANPTEASRFADSVCIGEAEGIWPQIIQDAQNGNLKPSYFSDKPTDLALCPAPRWDLIESKRYLYTNIINASRSCPFACEFCYNSCDYVHHSYRTKTVPQVIEEIKQLGTRHVMFIDDNFIGDVEWTKRLLRKMKPLGLKWNAAVSTNIGHHPDLLEEMKKSGCQSLFIGFETINTQSLTSVNKKQNKIEDYKKTINLIHAREIMINASLVFGFDHDYPDVFEDTLAWLIENKIETMTGHILTPYPGTKLFRRLEEENRITDYNWSHYNTAHVVYEPQNMTKEQLYKGYLWMYEKFYSLGNILKRLPTSKEQRLAYLMFNLGYRKYGRLTARIAKLGLMHRVGQLARKLAYGIE